MQTKDLSSVYLLAAHCIATCPEVLNRLGCTSKFFLLFLIVLFHSQAPILNPALLSGPAVPFLSMSVADVTGTSSCSPDTAVSNCSTERLVSEGLNPGLHQQCHESHGTVMNLKAVLGSLLVRGVQNKTSYDYGSITRLSCHVAECKTVLHVSKCWENSISFPFNYQTYFLFILSMNGVQYQKS